MGWEHLTSGSDPHSTGQTTWEERGLWSQQAEFESCLCHLLIVWTNMQNWNKNDYPTGLC